MNPLLSAATGHLPAITADLTALVETESYSRDTAALAAALADIRALTVLRLGEPEHEYTDSDGVHGPLLGMTYPGTGPGRVLILSHYDTVWPAGTLADWPVTAGTDAAGRTTLSGPGIFDMKAGLVQGIWALKLLLERGAARPAVTFLFTGDEEIGSVFSRPAIEKAALEADAVLVLEATADGAVKTGRKGVGIFTVTATGIEAHAGLNPTEGASAVHGIAEFITAAAAVADLSAGTSVNVGLVQGGSGTNVSAGQAVASVDIRVTTPEEMDRVDRAFDAFRPSDPRVRISIDHFWNRPPMNPPAANPLLDVVRAAALDFGHRLQDVSVGGGSDANFVAALGIPVLCGMGAVGDGAHARHEYIYPDALPLYTALLAESLRRLADGPGALGR